MRSSKFSNHLIALEKSGMSIAEYARRHGLFPRALYQARARARSEGGGSAISSSSRGFIRLVSEAGHGQEKRLILDRGPKGLWHLRIENIPTRDVSSILASLDMESP